MCDFLRINDESVVLFCVFFGTEKSRNLYNTL